MHFESRRDRCSCYAFEKAPTGVPEFEWHRRRDQGKAEGDDYEITLENAMRSISQVRRLKAQVFWTTGPFAAASKPTKVMSMEIPAMLVSFAR